MSIIEIIFLNLVGKMKHIYIVLTDTGAFLSKIIKIYTKDEFAHVSIALDKELNRMYSFGRIYPYNPFYGGFVHEYIDKGTFKRFHKTKTQIIELEINDKQYKNIEELINKFDNRKKELKFNVKGLFAVGFNKKITKEDSFYCAEFLKYILNKSEIKIELPELVRPENFKNLKDGKIIYSGILKDYKI